ncbi:MAG TPA: hypothetical protein VD998_02485 [Verrucomicrobiae bacterium]|nr:hypothetical protein [Verrucomicrobiae bacterium]
MAKKVDPDKSWDVDVLYKEMTEEGRSFWTVVYPLFMERHVTKADVRKLVRRGLSQCIGNYKVLTRHFAMPAKEYKRFLNFLRKHDCQLDFKEFRRAPVLVHSAPADTVPATRSRSRSAPEMAAAHA